MKKITKEFLKKHNACTDGYKRFFELFPKGTDAKTGVIGLSSDDNESWSRWLLIKCLRRKQRMQYAIFSAELVLHLFEKEYPEDKRPRKAIEAAKKALEDDSEKNRIAAAAASGSAYSAAYAANSANYASYAAAADDYAADNAAASAYSAFDAGTRKETQIKIMNYGIKLMEEEDERKKKANSK